MKKVFVASISKTSFDAISYSEDIRGIFARISELGYDGIELGIRNPLDVQSDLLKDYSEEFKLPVVAIGTGQAYVDEGLSLTDSNPDIQRKAIERLNNHIVLARELGASVIVGLIRGNPSRAEKQKAFELLEKNLMKCIDYASAKDVLILLEPVNRYESSLINTLSQGVEFIRRVNANNIKLLADTFHMNIEEADIVESIEKAFSLLGHIHVADSNRLAPGLGHTDFDSIFVKLKSLGYNRYISAEILPEPNFNDAARLTMDFLRSKDVLL